MDIKDLSREERRKVSGRKCPKCNGYMVYDSFYDQETGESHRGWRCINCGKIIDQVMLQNRPLGNQIEDLAKLLHIGGDE